MGFELVDIGVNLTNRQFRDDLPEVLERAARAGVEQLVVTGTNLHASERALEIAEQYDLWCTCGVHPHDAKEWSNAYQNRIGTLLNNPRVRAVGECGLDYNRNYSPPEDQRFAFAAQIEMAASSNMPLFLHERDAADDFFSILEPKMNSVRAAVLHCFTGSRRTLDRALELGLHIGVTGWICDERRGEELQQMVKHIPSDRLMLETDAPYLLPRNLHPRPKSRRNEPSYLPHVLATVAHHRGEDPVELAASTTQNARRFFGSSPGENGQDPRKTQDE